MELSLICPVAHLNATSLLPGRFCIATVAAKFAAYRDYFAEAGVQGYEVILDNGIFENEQLSTEEYLDEASYIKPTVIVAPDLIGADADANWMLATEFYEKAQKLCLHNDYMYVVQCKRNESSEFAESLGGVIRDSRFKWIGICRDAAYNAFGEFTHTEDQELNRFYFSTWAQQDGYVKTARANGKKWHYLGIGEQLHLIKHYWFVDSMDTASFFLQAAYDNSPVKGILPPKPRRPRDYFRRDFGPPEYWEDALAQTCEQALLYASEAETLKHRILGDRL